MNPGFNKLHCGEASLFQGVKVTFTVTSGGGSATGSEAVTDSAGFASVGSWTLGPELGTNTMTARVAGSDVAPFVFIATAMCDCWKSKGALNVRRSLPE